MLEPAVKMTIARTAMRPMNDAALRIPFIFAAKFNRIAQLDRHARRKINVVRDQQCRTIGASDDETLMTNPVLIVLQNADDFPATAHRARRDLSRPRRHRNSFRRSRPRWLIRPGRDDNWNGQKNNKQQQLLHDKDSFRHNRVSCKSQSVFRETACRFLVS